MNKIKTLRKKLGLSQAEFAKRYKLSVRTLQQWEQGISEPLDSLIMLIERDINGVSNLRYEYKHSNSGYKVCIDNAFKNCNKIYPIQQRKVQTIINDLKKDKNVIKIVVFGSSVTDRCHIGSDVDIYFESMNENIKLKDVYDFRYDLWNNYTVDKRLKNEIDSKGVIVYERN